MWIYVVLYHLNCCPFQKLKVYTFSEDQQVFYLLRYLAKHDHHIIGFDLVEVGAHEYDANVGARLLYEMCVLGLMN